VLEASTRRFPLGPDVDLGAVAAALASSLSGADLAAVASAALAAALARTVAQLDADANGAADLASPTFRARGGGHTAAADGGGEGGPSDGDGADPYADPYADPSTDSEGLCSQPTPASNVPLKSGPLVLSGLPLPWPDLALPPSPAEAAALAAERQTRVSELMRRLKVEAPARLVPTVCMADFLGAAAAAHPSVSPAELAHYEDLRRRFCSR
jgi:SpoVK/Ycf46/Vps4 family AAA+-type ATPase